MLQGLQRLGKTGRERSSQTQVLPVPGVWLVHFYYLGSPTPKALLALIPLKMRDIHKAFEVAAPPVFGIQTFPEIADWTY